MKKFKFFTFYREQKTVRSGNIYVSMSYGNTLRPIGLTEYEWSRFAEYFGKTTWTSGTDNNSLAYYFSFNATAYPDNAAERWFGFPLRCLSTAVEGEESEVDLRSYRFTVY